MATPLKVGVIGLGHLHPRSYMLLFQAVKTLQVVAVSEASEPLTTWASIGSTCSAGCL
jgi:hypothetical protein